MKDMNKICKECQEQLPDLLLDPASVSAEVEAHVTACVSCTEELSSLRATFAAMDAWTAPEPSAYFDTRLYARLREAQVQPAEGFFERMRSYFTFSTGRHLRPAMTAALSLALVISGGSYVGTQLYHGAQPRQASATVDDLKVLENNAQALQQMDQLLDDNDDDTPPTT